MVIKLYGKQINSLTLQRNHKFNQFLSSFSLINSDYHCHINGFHNYLVRLMILFFFFFDILIDKTFNTSPRQTDATFLLHGFSDITVENVSNSVGLFAVIPTFVYSWNVFRRSFVSICFFFDRLCFSCEQTTPTAF